MKNIINIYLYLLLTPYFRGHHREHLPLSLFHAPVTPTLHSVNLLCGLPLFIPFIQYIHNPSSAHVQTISTLPLDVLILSILVTPSRQTITF